MIFPVAGSRRRSVRICRPCASAVLFLRPLLRWYSQWWIRWLAGLVSLFSGKFPEVATNLPAATAVYTAPFLPVALMLRLGTKVCQSGFKKLKSGIRNDIDFWYLLLRFSKIKRETPKWQNIFPGIQISPVRYRHISWRERSTCVCKKQCSFIILDKGTSKKTCQFSCIDAYLFMLREFVGEPSVRHAIDMFCEAHVAGCLLLQSVRWCCSPCRHVHVCLHSLPNSPRTTCGDGRALRCGEERCWSLPRPAGGGGCMGALAAVIVSAIGHGVYPGPIPCIHLGELPPTPTRPGELQGPHLVVLLCT